MDTTIEPVTIALLETNAALPDPSDILERFAEHYRASVERQRAVDDEGLEEGADGADDELADFESLAAAAFEAPPMPVDDAVAMEDLAELFVPQADETEGLTELEAAIAAGPVTESFTAVRLDELDESMDLDGMGAGSERADEDDEDPFLADIEPSDDPDTVSFAASAGPDTASFGAADADEDFEAGADPDTAGFEAAEPSEEVEAEPEDATAMLDLASLGLDEAEAPGEEADTARFEPEPADMMAAWGADEPEDGIAGITAEAPVVSDGTAEVAAEEALAGFDEAVDGAPAEVEVEAVSDDDDDSDGDDSDGDDSDSDSDGDDGVEASAEDGDSEDAPKRKPRRSRKARKAKKK